MNKTKAAAIRAFFTEDSAAFNLEPSVLAELCEAYGATSEVEIYRPEITHYIFSDASSIKINTNTGMEEQ